MGDFGTHFGIKLINSDARGTIYELQAQEKLHINFATIRKGYARGGHSHQHQEGLFVITGKIECHKGTIDKERVVTVDAGSTIFTMPMEPHYILALEDSVFVELRPDAASYFFEDYEPFRSIVRRLAEKG